MGNMNRKKSPDADDNNDVFGRLLGMGYALDPTHPTRKRADELAQSEQRRREVEMIKEGLKPSTVTVTIRDYDRDHIVYSIKTAPERYPESVEPLSLAERVGREIEERLHKLVPQRKGK